VIAMTEQLQLLVRDAQQRFAQLLKSFLATHQLDAEIYQRYLSMQYHLTKGVQRYFITAAAHASMQRMKPLRKFLLEFGCEEELHYLVAGNDLQKMGLSVLPIPFDVVLWHSYFDETTVRAPFQRLGAACILENLSDNEVKPLAHSMLSAPFLSKQNTKFLVLHMHETLPHGKQIVDALEQANLNTQQWQDVCEGAAKASVMYLRMAEWALFPECLASIADQAVQDLSVVEQRSIAMLDMAEVLG
jgi:heme oxygenase